MIIHSLIVCGSRVKTNRQANIYWRLFQTRLAIVQVNLLQTLNYLTPRRTAHIDTLISKVRGGTKKLCEYRTALISAAVTGKIIVRKAV